MALKLDNALLDELGLGALPDAEKQLLLRQIYEKLEMNVGMRLADQMSNEQLDAFEKFVDANDDKGAFQWLETNFPNYKQVVNEEFEKLKYEIKGVAPQILASAQSNAAQGGQSGQPIAQGQPVPQQPQATPAQYQQQPPAYQPQPTYQTAPPAQPAPAAQPAPQSYQAGAAPQAGHLQPQYGAPQAPQQQPSPQQQPLPQQPAAGQYQTQPGQQQPQPPQYPPQPPAGQ